MRRAPALAGTFFTSWANHGFTAATRQTGEWLRGGRSNEGADPSRTRAGSPTTTLWITLEDWLHAESIDRPGPAAAVAPTERILFVAPPFGKGSGGHWDIMRLVAALHEAGAHAELRLYLADGHVDLVEQRRIIREHFPIASVPCELWDRAQVGASDAVVATGWNTAFAALNCAAGRKVYMVQDYEPLFYPMGTDSVLAEMTYDFGFDLLAAGDWLPAKLRHRTIGRVATFPLGFDGAVYRCRSAWEARRGVVFYMRPATPRRAWEFGVEALRSFHARHPDAPIHLVGGRTTLRLPFPATVHDVMTPTELAALYNQCRVGFAISLSNTSLLPVEMLASGTEVVTNDSEANRANLGEIPGVTLSPLRIQALASALDHAYTNPVDPWALATGVQQREWGHAFDDAVRFLAS